ncbi:MAG: hypothetical protein H7X71_03015 [Chitinophagales bacterium]|nr:hypothetical protein [Chitinophagales bacterium]
MKKAVACLFVLIYVFAMAKPFIPFISYSLNKAYIQKNLCENIDKPAMHCEGKCYIEKQMAEAVNQAKEQKQEASNTIPLPDFQTINHHILFSFHFSAHQNAEVAISSLRDLCFYDHKFSRDVFNPPDTVS